MPLPKDIKLEAHDLLYMNLDQRRDLCERVQRRSKFGFSLEKTDYYVPKAHLYHFSSDDEWIAIRCPFVPAIYISKGGDNIPNLWYIISINSVMNQPDFHFWYELETATTVSFCKFPPYQ